jgi:hypothetical protein
VRRVFLVLLLLLPVGLVRLELPEVGAGALLLLRAQVLFDEGVDPLPRVREGELVGLLAREDDLLVEFGFRRVLVIARHAARAEQQQDGGRERQLHAVAAGRRFRLRRRGRARLGLGVGRRRPLDEDLAELLLDLLRLAGIRRHVLLDEVQVLPELLLQVGAMERLGAEDAELQVVGIRVEDAVAEGAGAGQVRRHQRRHDQLLGEPLPFLEVSRGGVDLEEPHHDLGIFGVRRARALHVIHRAVQIALLQEDVARLHVVGGGLLPQALAFEELRDLRDDFRVGRRLGRRREVHPHAPLAPARLGHPGHRKRHRLGHRQEPDPAAVVEVDQDLAGLELRDAAVLDDLGDRDAAVHQSVGALGGIRRDLVLLMAVALGDEREDRVDEGIDWLMTAHSSARRTASRRRPLTSNDSVVTCASGSLSSFAAGPSTNSKSAFFQRKRS